MVNYKQSFINTTPTGAKNEREESQKEPEEPQKTCLSGAGGSPTREQERIQQRGPPPPQQVSLVPLNQSEPNPNNINSPEVRVVEEMEQLRERENAPEMSVEKGSLPEDPEEVKVASQSQHGLVHELGEDASPEGVKEVKIDSDNRSRREVKIMVKGKGVK